MVVHFVSSRSDLAQGRFLGPCALLERLEKLLPEMTSHPFSQWEWRPWIDVMEGAGVVVPISRWRVPVAVLRHLWADHDQRQLPPEEAAAEVGQAFSALGRWHEAQLLWGRRGFAKQRDHPLDAPPDGAAEFLECTAAHPWTVDIYAPPLIRELPNGVSFRDQEACVPLFRAWQVIHVAEHFISEPRNFAGLTDKDISSTPAKGLASLPWRTRSNAEGFLRHRPVLEVLSWYGTYANHALMLAETVPPDLGMFGAAAVGSPARGGLSEIRGEAFQALRAAEALVAREALVRHGVDHDAMLRGATWLGEAGVRRRRSGHEAMAKAYGALMRQAIELLTDDGLDVSDIKARLGDGDRHLDTLFPSWIAGRRKLLKLQLRPVILAFGRWPDPAFPTFDEAAGDEFLAWLEAEGLLGAHMAVGALIEYGHRPDPDADVGTAFHVASLAAWVEHVCNALLKDAAAPASTLDKKIPDCWAGHVREQEFLGEWGRRGVPRSLGGLRDRLAHVFASPAANRVAWAARDARVALSIRNAGLHSGFRDLSRSEMHEAVHVILCVAVHAWLVHR